MMDHDEASRKPAKTHEPERHFCERVCNPERRSTQAIIYSASLYLLADMEIVLDSSEYLAHCDERRAFISGFDGSAGDNFVG